LEKALPPKTCNQNKRMLQKINVYNVFQINPVEFFGENIRD